ncbi:MAG TPA: YbaK/EbsC family protein [Mycobacteriales bacterium]|nr:YbaK/EbsC family protein [Mycobacteriales bacterium]
MRTALDVHRALLERGVAHEVVRLRTRVSSADDLPSALGLGADGGCLAVRLYAVVPPPGGLGPPDDGVAAPRWVAVLVPAGKLPDPVALLAALDAGCVRPATPGEVNAVTGYADGLVSPADLPAGVEVLADAAVGLTDVVYTAAGEGGVALGVRTRDLLVACGARAASLAPAPVPLPEPRFADIVDLDAVRHGAHPPGAAPAP